MAVAQLGKHAARAAAPLKSRRLAREWNPDMNNIIYLVGLVVIVLAILSFLGLN